MGGAYLTLSAYQSHTKATELQRFIDDRIMRSNASIDRGRPKEAEALVSEILSRQGDNAVALSLRDRIAASRKEASAQAASARRSLAQRDLASARRAAEAVRERDADSAEYVRLNADLVPREQQRDRLINDARRCASNGDRACALTLIERALQVDRESPVKEIWAMVGIQAEPPPAAAVPSPSPAQRAVARPQVVAPTPSLSADQEKAVECAAYVRSGRRALQNKAYDQAITSADDALNTLPNCQGALELKTEAEHALQQARSIPVLN
jgi:tetratricopeptide (TPR) repeat protein